MQIVSTPCATPAQVFDTSGAAGSLQDNGISADTALFVEAST